MLLFEKELGFSNAEADTQFALWSGVCYVMPLFGGWIADRFLGELVEVGCQLCPCTSSMERESRHTHQYVRKTQHVQSPRCIAG